MPTEFNYTYPGFQAPDFNDLPAQAQVPLVEGPWGHGPTFVPDPIIESAFFLDFTEIISPFDEALVQYYDGIVTLPLDPDIQSVFTFDDTEVAGLGTDLDAALIIPRITSQYSIATTFPLESLLGESLGLVDLTEILPAIEADPELLPFMFAPTTIPTFGVPPVTPSLFLLDDTEVAGLGTDLVASQIVIRQPFGYDSVHPLPLVTPGLFALALTEVLPPVLFAGVRGLEAKLRYPTYDESVRYPTYNDVLSYPNYDEVIKWHS